MGSPTCRLILSVNSNIEYCFYQLSGRVSQNACRVGRGLCDVTLGIQAGSDRNMQPKPNSITHCQKTVGVM